MNIINNKKNMMDLYSELDTNNKRNEFSSLIIKINYILDEYLKQNNLVLNRGIKNYDHINENKLTEDEMLSFFYDDLWTIKDKLYMLMSKDANNKK